MELCREELRGVDLRRSARPGGRIILMYNQPHASILASISLFFYSSKLIDNIYYSTLVSLVFAVILVVILVVVFVYACICFARVAHLCLLPLPILVSDYDVLFGRFGVVLFMLREWSC